MRSPVTALLGPTNTGKTYLALERMLAHRTGMMGFPLRLLARENYDRLVGALGSEAVALVTGEERIVPARPRYWVATVEAMPLDRTVDFLAVDEVQLAADRERGHVFTDRILHARGREETMLIGAETIRPLLRRLLPEAAFISRPRLSTLKHASPKKIGRLPRRSAVIVFSIPELYRLAERLRREQGGAALVFGALSPRTRNAQVGLYESGEVDLLVATDAIGMGLNLDIDCVVFTALDKHDGIGRRALTTAEVAQIAGRAGRHVRDGHFAPTTDLGPLDDRLVRAVEDHRFPPLDTLFWRNRELDYASGAALLASLERPVPHEGLRRISEADDHRALRALLALPDVSDRSRGQEAVRLLWDVCQVPDFQGTRSDGHAFLLAECFRHLSGPAHRLPEAWVAESVRDLDRLDGPMDLLLVRLAGIRTWTYLAHRSGWLSDARHWQERARAVEDRLSDALHERLTEEYVDRPAAILLRYDPAELITVVTDGGEVLVQGLRAGHVEGFRFHPDPAVRGGSKGLLAAANRSLRGAIRDRVKALAAEPDEAFTVLASGVLAWRGAPVARLAAGESALLPQVEVLPSDLLDAPLREQVRRRLATWVEESVKTRLAPLLGLGDRAPAGAARGLAFALCESLGTVARRAVASQVAALTQDDRRFLARCGVTLGRLSVYLPALLHPDTLRLRARLFVARHGGPGAAAPDGIPSVPLDAALPAAFYAACGYQPVGPKAVRVDRLDRVAASLARLAREGPFALPPETARLLGVAPNELAAVLAGMGYVEREGRYSIAARSMRRTRRHRL
ncbi:MAG TPA: helicase-related protein [Vicinamibacteria bacterium]